MLTVRESICCCHQHDSRNDNRHNHSIPGAAKQLAEEENDFCSSETEMAFKSMFCPTTLSTGMCKTVYLSYAIDIPIIKKHNMRC